MIRLELWHPDNLEVSYLTADSSRRSLSVAGVSFSGTYPPGSMGNRHGVWISRKVIGAYIEFDPIVMVIDFGGMHYEWGNSLLKVFQDWEEMCRDYPPLHVVVSEKCSGAVRSLLGDPMKELIFDSVEDAFRNATCRAEDWLETD